MRGFKKQFTGTSIDKDRSATFDNAAARWVKYFFHEGTYPSGTRADFDKAKPLEVIGPYADSVNVTIYKIAGRRIMADSVMVRQILISYNGVAWGQFTRTKIQAKALADSLQQVIASGNTKMEDLVMKFTDDPGSRQGNLGNYGWIPVENGFIEGYAAVGFDNPVGTTLVIDSIYGYHVVQVVSKSKEYDGVVGYSITEPVVWPKRSAR